MCGGTRGSSAAIELGIMKDRKRERGEGRSHSNDDVRLTVDAETRIS